MLNDLKFGYVVYLMLAEASPVQRIQELQTSSVTTPYRHQIAAKRVLYVFTTKDRHEHPEIKQKKAVAEADRTCLKKNWFRKDSPFSRRSHHQVPSIRSDLVPELIVVGIKMYN